MVTLRDDPSRNPKKWVQAAEFVPVSMCVFMCVYVCVGKGWGRGQEDLGVWWAELRVDIIGFQGKAYHGPPSDDAKLDTNVSISILFLPFLLFSLVLQVGVSPPPRVQGSYSGALGQGLGGKFLDVISKEAASSLV